MSTAAAILMVLGLLGLWGSAYGARMRVIDMASLYHPATHGAPYKERCLELWAEYKQIRFMALLATVISASTYFTIGI